MTYEVVLQEKKKRDQKSMMLYVVAKSTTEFLKKIESYKKAWDVVCFQQAEDAGLKSKYAVADEAGTDVFRIECKGDVNTVYYIQALSLSNAVNYIIEKYGNKTILSANPYTGECKIVL